MKIEMSGVMIAGALALGLAACSPKPDEPSAAAPAADKPMAGMPMDTPATAAVTGLIMGTGKVVAIDSAAGAVTLDHGPIPALNWSRMTMAFTVAEPALLAGVVVGDTLAFEIKSASESTVITQLHKQ